MEDLEKLKVAQDWITKLANGINPLDGSQVNENDIVNNVHISRCLFFVADVLKEKKVSKPKISKPTRELFNSSSVNLDEYKFRENITLTDFAKAIKRLTPNNVRPLSYDSFIKWIMKEELLIEVNNEQTGHLSHRTPTGKGIAVGIHNEIRTNASGITRQVTLYNIDAQRFLLENLDNIMELTYK